MRNLNIVGFLPGLGFPFITIFGRIGISEIWLCKKKKKNIIACHNVTWIVYGSVASFSKSYMRPAKSRYTLDICLFAKLVLFSHLLVILKGSQLNYQVYSVIQGAILKHAFAHKGIMNLVARKPVYCISGQQEQTSLRIRAVWSQPSLFTWGFYKPFLSVKQLTVSHIRLYKRKNLFTHLHWPDKPKASFLARWH